MVDALGKKIPYKTLLEERDPESMWRTMLMLTFPLESSSFRGSGPGLRLALLLPWLLWPPWPGNWRPILLLLLPPSVIQVDPEQGADSEETPDAQSMNDSSLWITPPVMNPRQILLNTSVDSREAHIDRTYMHLFRASTILVDYKILLKDYQTVFEEKEGLKSQISRVEGLEAELAAAKGENQRLTMKLEATEAARCRARDARRTAEAKLEEEKKRAADAEARAVAAEEKARNLEETSRVAEERAIVAEERNTGLVSKVRKLNDDC